jgi:hypothetical protein
MLGGIPPERKDHNMKNITKTIAYLQMTALFLTASLGGLAAAGEQVPFKGNLEGSFTTVLDPGPPPIGHVVGSGAGNATYLGRFTYEIDAYVNFGAVPPTAAGIYTFTAANGDTLVAEFTGRSTPVEPGVIFVVDEAVITGGTGRFAGATGSFTVMRLAATGFTSGSFEGTIVIH